MANIVTCPQCAKAYTLEANAEPRCPHCGSIAAASSTEATLRSDAILATPPPPPPARTSRPPAAAKGGKRPAALAAARQRVSPPPVAAGGSDKTMVEPTATPAPAGAGTDFFQPTIGKQQVDDAWGATIRTLPPDASAGMTIKQEKQKADIHASHYHVQRRLFGDARQPPAAAAVDFKIEKVLGEGGMGIVYTAMQTSLARSIALKMIKGEAAKTPGAKDKFLAEAVVTGDLEHPNIVPVYDLGVNEKGQIFYAMKQVKGTAWHKAIAEKTLEENLEILLKVADAVAYAHAKGVIHRDLKPENVMLGEFGEVVVMDWGLAASIAPGGKAEPIDKNTAVCGTPAYLAPEMAVGDPAKINTWSDIYLLGGILYEIVTGLKPHAGKNIMDCLYQAAANVIQPSPIQGELVDIALKAMAADPAERYATVKDFQNAIRAYRAHFESIALATTAAENLRRAEDKADYPLFAQALFGFQSALKLWDGNDKAREGMAATTLAYAACALAKGDLDLAASLLETADSDEADALRRRVVAGQRERASRQRRMRLLKAVSVVSAAAVVIISLVAALVVWQQYQVAVTEKRRAEEQEKLATRHAEEARKNAEAATRAQKDTELALVETRKAKESAEQAEKEARAQQKRAEEERQRAEDALAKFKAEQEAKIAAEAKAKEAVEDKEAIARLATNNWWTLPPEKAQAEQAETAARAGLPPTLDVSLPGGGKIEFVLVPAGEFGMGSPRHEKSRAGEEVVHVVSISRPFYLGRTEVTRGQWRAIMGEVADAAQKDDADLPMTNITFRDVQDKFLPRVQALAPPGYALRLPTEAEWEYACRAGANTPYYLGSDHEALLKAGWCILNSEHRLQPVAKLTANAWGLYDMHGNAAEFCADAYEPEFYLRSPVEKAAVDPFNAKEGAALRVVRGGGWAHLPEHCRSAYRNYAHENNKYDFLGLRLAASPKEE